MYRRGRFHVSEKECVRADGDVQRPARGLWRRRVIYRECQQLLSGSTTTSYTLGGSIAACLAEIAYVERT
jgi:hypothetical protein